MKKMIVVFFILMSIGLPLGANAENIHLSVEVVKRQPTDTINDFDFSTVNITYPEQGQVKGTSTTNETAANQVWSFLLSSKKWQLWSWIF